MNQEQFSYPTKHEPSSKEKFYSSISSERKKIKENTEKTLTIEEELWNS